MHLLQARLQRECSLVERGQVRPVQRELVEALRPGGRRFGSSGGFWMNVVIPGTTLVLRMSSLTDCVGASRADRLAPFPAA